MILTGGIGSGKSHVARLLADRGWTVIEADRLGHELLELGGAAFDDVGERWPQVVVDGRIDRRRLADIVFTEPDQLQVLEAMTHPRIRDRILEHAAETPGPLLVEIPILRPWFPEWPVVAVVAPESVRRRRLLDRGMDPADIERRMAAQPSYEEWLAAADHVVVNDGRDLGEELGRLDEFLAEFSVPDHR